jgi:VHL beta domain
MSRSNATAWASVRADRFLLLSLAIAAPLASAAVAQAPNSGVSSAALVDLPMHLDACPASPQAFTPKTEITFVNQMGAAITVLWSDYAGIAKPYATILPSQSIVQTTNVGQAWLLKDEQGNVLGHFIAAEKLGAATGTRVAVKPGERKPWLYARTGWWTAWIDGKRVRLVEGKKNKRAAEVGIAELKRHAIWTNDCRNRQIANLAASNLRKAETACRRFEGATARLASSQELKTGILVENIEHALELARKQRRQKSVIFSSSKHDRRHM